MLQTIGENLQWTIDMDLSAWIKQNDNFNELYTGVAIQIGMWDHLMSSSEGCLSTKANLVNFSTKCLLPGIGEVW